MSVDIIDKPPGGISIYFAEFIKYYGYYGSEYREALQMVLT